jgi:hypothetical protein
MPLTLSIVIIDVTLVVLAAKTSRAMGLHHPVSLAHRAVRAFRPDGLNCRLNPYRTAVDY